MKANYIYSGNNHLIIFNHIVGDEALLSKILCIMHFVSSSMLKEELKLKFLAFIKLSPRAGESPKFISRVAFCYKKANEISI